MLLKIPYVYYVTGKVKGTRGMDRALVGDWRAFEIEEIEPDDAPVAVSWRASLARPTFAPHIVGKNAVVEVRHRDGIFYRPFNMVDHGIRQALSPERFATGGHIIDYRALSEDLEPQLAAFASGTPFPRPVMTGDIFSTEDEIVKAYEHALADIVLIDGCVWQVCPEPKLYFDEHPRDASGHVIAEFPDQHRSIGTVRDFKFPIVALDQAKWFAEQRLLDRGKEDTSIDPRLDVTVFQENAFKRYDPGVEIARHAASFVEEAGKLRMNDRSADYVYAWAQFRRACEKAFLTPDDLEIEALLDAWEEFSQADLADKSAAADEDIDPKQDYCANLQFSFAALWERRPVVIEDVKFGMRR